MSAAEEPLSGNATAGVVRVGDTVRRPAGPWSDAVDALLEHLHEVGFSGAPRPLGRDAQGRQVLEYVPGEVGAASGTYPVVDLFAIGRMLAELHEALAGFTPPAARRGSGSSLRTGRNSPATTTWPRGT
ncbi:hypothetical protein ACIBTZ_06045 [Micromonospora sp. NPDC049460]|uniref:hypothetical protein n=1 Tax=unclassified Micromonospora TaxID=2617518 RepID=UPI00371793B5